MSATVFDPRICTLGEGALWHPTRQQFFWFDIMNKRLLSRLGNQQMVWDFGEYVSAAGWVDHDHLLIASATQLFTFNLNDGHQKHLTDLEADNPVTRSNDGRADPWGGFWIGTMGQRLEPKAGAIYRFYQGRLTPLFTDITISNAICFSPDRAYAYFTDTPTHIIQRQALDRDGWPVGPPVPFIDARAEKLGCDGAVVDAAGNLWNAQWGSHRVACYGPDGQFKSAVEFPAAQISCPAFGGAQLNQLFATSAAENLATPSAADGQTFCVALDAQGQAEHQVIL